MYRKFTWMAGLTAGLFFALASVAFAASPWLLLGSAVPVKPADSPAQWAIQMLCEHGSPSGGIKFTAPSGKLTFSEIRDLSVGYEVKSRNTCLRDSPRLLIDLDTNGDGMADKSIVVYLGSPPALAACAKTWTATGNLVKSTAKRFNTNQFDQGTSLDTYAHALHLAGKDPVIDIFLIVDGGARDVYQNVLVDSVTINHFQLNAQSLGQ